MVYYIYFRKLWDQYSKMMSSYWPPKLTSYINETNIKNMKYEDD